MKAFIKSLLFLTTVASIFALPSPPNPQIFPSRCGDTFTVPSYARIEYKVGQNVNENELCPFIIRFESAASLQFGLLSSDFGVNDKLVVATLDVDQDTHPYTTVMSESVSMGDVGNVTLDGRIAVVVFSTFGSVGRTGFSLNIIRVGESTTPVSATSVDHIESGTTGEWMHPFSGEFYTSQELTTFIAAPENYTSSTHGVGTTRLQYRERSLDPDCYDAVNIWSFDRMILGRWQHTLMICDGDGPQDLTNLEDLALVTFVSDRAVNGLGFTVDYQRPNDV